MHIQLRPVLALASALALVAAPLSLASCSGSGSSSSLNAIASAIQDLTLDPEGLTTEITFGAAPDPALGPGNFEADGGQIALAVLVNGLVATVEWDERVTPSHEVRVIGDAGISAAWEAVSTSDASAPTFAIASALQVAGLGADTISVVFSGPHVVPSEAEDLARWALEVSSTELDLAGSTFDFDVPSQTLSITTGPGANLHAAFELAALSVHSVADVPVGSGAIAGAATGDTSAPALVSAEQNLPEDEFGRVVDFAFDEAMDPVFSVSLASFNAGFPIFATAVETPSANVLRVSFTAPIVPGVASVALSGLFDAHGNAFAGVAPIAAGSTVANDFDAATALVTVQNEGGDHLTAVFDQAFEPASAAVAANWRLEAPTGVPVDLSTLDLEYDLLTKTLSIELPDDYHNGDAFLFAPGLATQALDVDGEDFGASFNGTIAGDALAPSVSSVTQNRDLDSTGLTYDVVFPEHLSELEAETPANWSFTGGASVVSATLMPSQLTVRLVLDQVAIPGTDTLGVVAVDDLAGNPVAGAAALAIASTDASAPGFGLHSAEAVQGAENDIVAATFTDAMVESEVEDPQGWHFESPIGTPVDTALATVDYDAGSQRAVLTFDGGDDFNLQARATFQISFTGMRDIGGNPVEAGALTGVVDAEAIYPRLVAAWVDPGSSNVVHVRFSEPCDFLDDLLGETAYRVHDDLAMLSGLPGSVNVDADRMGGELVFGFSVSAGAWTLDASGIADLAGNAMFSVIDLPIDAEDPLEPGVDLLATGGLTVSGEENDRVVVVFDRPISSWGATDPAHYAFELGMGGPAVDLAPGSIAFDGLGTVTFDLDSIGADSLETAGGYWISADGLQSAQGVPMSVASAGNVGAAGDSVAPTLPAGRAYVDAADPGNSLLVEMDEALDPVQAAVLANVDILGVNPDSLTLVGPRVLRATFGGGVAIGQVVNVTLDDLAGNTAVASEAIAAADASGPLVVSVAGVIAPGYGGDRIRIEFDEAVEPGNAQDLAHYSATSGGQPLDLAGAAVRYESGSHTVVIELAAGVEFQVGDSLSVTTSGVADHSGNAMATPAILAGLVAGDALAPSIDEAFVNLRADPTGAVVDLLCSEDLEPLAAADALNWSATGLTVLSAELIRADIVRLTLSGPLAGGSQVGATGLSDVAGNTAGPLSVLPLH